MLSYYCISEDELPEVRRRGLHVPPGARAALRASLEQALEACGGCLLVLDAAGPAPQAAHRAGGEGMVFPPEAVRNLDPYLPPRPVTAAGGFLVRPGRRGPEVLLIFRRGVWDLPKGKLDKGETVEACALREVREELGIRRLRLVRPLGSTLHGYPEKGAYKIKTTYWYLMETSEARFTPQAGEGIDAVSWMPWEEAEETVGYDSLRAHMRQVEAAVRAHVQPGA
jgi:8-oxo-dGTP pyrophosphatase MutT (NUDIX family)